MAEYTEGPWIAEPTGRPLEWGWAVRPPGDYAIATVHWQLNSEGVPDYDAEANARLMAKAPQLLEALEEVRNGLSAMFKAFPPELQDVAQAVRTHDDWNALEDLIQEAGGTVDADED